MSKSTSNSLINTVKLAAVVVIFQALVATTPATANEIAAPLTHSASLEVTSK